MLSYFKSMVSINDMRKRLTAPALNQVVQDSIEDNRDAIRELQIDQLKHGKNKKGELIGKYRSKSYAKKKNQLNPLAGLGNVDLILTGALKNDIFVDVRPDVFVIDSADSKTGELIKKYGDPFGLSKESNIELLPALQKTAVKRTKEKMRI